MNVTKWLLTVLAGAVLLSVLGVMPDGHANTSLPKEVVKDYARGKRADALKGVTDRVRELSEDGACQDPYSWSCGQIHYPGIKLTAAGL